MRVLREKGRMHTHMHCPAVYSRFIVQGVGNMKNGPSKMDLSLKFRLKTFEIQTFFIHSIIGKFFNIKKYFDKFIVYYAYRPIFAKRKGSFYRFRL